jgi:hypothetical protein
MTENSSEQPPDDSGPPSGPAPVSIYTRIMTPVFDSYRKMRDWFYDHHKIPKSIDQKDQQKGH